MSDVARLAGVSAQTVSRVAAGSEHVRPDTRERVLRAMNQLGYSPNRAAQALRRGSFKTIGVLTQQIQRTGEALTTAGVLEAATAADYAVNLVQVEHPASNDLREAVYRLSHQAIDGLVVVQAGRAGREQLVLPPSMPVAVSDSTLVDYYPSASADQVGGVRDAVEHLLELGHRTVHHVSGPEDSQSSLIRRATWARCLQEAGREVPEPVPGGWEAAAGYEAGLHLATDPEVTAVFCANDELALGLIRAMHEQGRRVPRDVSVVGFDDHLLASQYSPGITTVHQPLREEGARAAELALAMIDGAPPETVVMDMRLVERASV